MRPAADQLDDALAAINITAPSINVVNNVDVSVESSAEAIKDALVRQLYCPVQWTRTVEFLAAQGVEKIIEVGPGKVLTGLTKRIDKALTSVAVNTPDTLADL